MVAGSVLEVGGRRYYPGNKVEAVVLKVLPLGVLVQLRDGNQGVIRRRELSWDRRISEDDLSQIAPVGCKVAPVVIGVDDRYQRLILSLHTVMSVSCRAKNTCHLSGTSGVYAVV